MLRAIGPVTGLVLLMVACGGGGAMSAPHDLQYAVANGGVGSPYGPYSPSVSGIVTGYSVSPALPAGLTLNPNSGVIAGTPIAASSATTYTVTASNGAGATTAALTFEILVAAPAALAYPSPVTGMVGAALSPLVPTLTGHADAFSVSPPLPAGVMLDPATGIVSGTPTSARLPLTYTILASGPGGSTQSQLLLSVAPPPAGTAVTGVFGSDTVIGLGYVSGAHSGLTDKNGAFTYEQGQGVTFSVGAVSIGGLATAKTMVTPVDLVAQGTSASNRVLNVVRFLMMLDQDGNANNGIQISPAVTAAAASWAPVDFDTADLPTTLAPIIQQANAADGVSHVLPDAATAQAQLRTAYYCTRSGNYYGTFQPNSPGPPDPHGDFVASVLPDGRMVTTLYLSSGVPWFSTFDMVNASLDATFAENVSGPRLLGSFADATYLSGTYPLAGNFQAAGDATVTATYKFTGSYTETLNDPTKGGPSSGSVNFGIDDSNRVSGTALGVLAGTVSGDTFTGTDSYFRLDTGPHHMFHFPVSGTYSNTASGISFDGKFSTDRSVVTFSAVGCRAN